MAQRTYWGVLVVIIILGGVLRFWNFNSRLPVYSDSARDALLAQAALSERRLPLTGSFSSSGPFVFGPIYYWFLMLIYWAFPNWVFAPWYAVGMLSLLSCFLLAEAGRILAGKKVGIIVALFAAISPAQIIRAIGLTQHSVVGVMVTVAIWCLSHYHRSHKSGWVLGMGMAIGVAVSLHYQALGLLAMGLAVILVRWKDGLVFGIGSVLPSVPLLYWDYGQRWANTRNLLDFIFIAQERIYIGRRWLTFVTDFLPDFFSSVVGGFPLLAIFGVILGIVLFLYKRGRWPSMMVWLVIVLAIQIVILRYAKVELFEGYLVFLHPFLLLLFGWVVAASLEIKRLRLAAVILAIAIIVGSLKKDVDMLSPAHANVILFSVEQTVEKLINRYPGRKFMPYDNGYMSTEFSYALSLLLNQWGLVARDGIPIGICKWACPKDLGTELVVASQIVAQNTTTYGVNDLSDLPKQKLLPPTWYDVSPVNTLQEVGFWWQKQPLTSPFSLSKFIRGRASELILGR